MSKLFTYLTLGTAILTGIIISGLFIGSPQQVDWSANKPTFSPMLAILIGFSTQIGLGLAPFVTRKHIILRLGVILLMIPFSYFVLFHDLVDLVSQVVNANKYYFEKWTLNPWSQLFSTSMILLCSIFYAYNIFLLLFVDLVPQTIAKDVASGTPKESIDGR